MPGLLCLCLAMVYVGCKSEKKVSADINLVGNYTLVSVDAKAVPCAMQHEGHALTIKSGSFVISGDGTCSSKMLFSPPSGSDAISETKANYTREGARLKIKWEGAGMTAGTVEGDTCTMNNEGMVLTYRKQG